MSEMVPMTSVVVVDDDENLCRSTARFLRASGIQVACYLSAQEFLDCASRPHFDCLLLDIQLDGMSGIELSERLAASGCATPVIFITANDEPVFRARALATGCVAYLRKCEPGDAILAAISRATHSNE